MALSVELWPSRVPHPSAGFCGRGSATRSVVFDMVVELAFLMTKLSPYYDRLNGETFDKTMTRSAYQLTSMRKENIQNAFT